MTETEGSDPNPYASPGVGDEAAERARDSRWIALMVSFGCSALMGLGSFALLFAVASRQVDWAALAIRALVALGVGAIFFLLFWLRTRFALDGVDAVRQKRRELLELAQATRESLRATRVEPPESHA